MGVFCTFVRFIGFLDVPVEGEDVRHPVWNCESELVPGGWLVFAHRLNLLNYEALLKMHSIRPCTTTLRRVSSSRAGKSPSPVLGENKTGIGAGGERLDLSCER